MKKSLLLLLPFVIIVSSVLIIFTARHSATPKATLPSPAGWQTYTNTKYGFKFQYPSGWDIKLETSNPFDILSLRDKSGEIFIFFQAYDNPHKYTLKKFWQERIKIAGEVVSDPYSVDALIQKDFIISGYPSLRFYQSGAVRVDAVNIQKGDYIYQIALGLRGEDLPGGKEININSEKIYNQILSTFKFTQ